MVNGSLLLHDLLMINHLGLLKRMVLILDGFNLFILKSSLSVTLSIESRVSLKQLIGTFKLNRSGWGLVHSVNRDLRQVQIREGSLNLIEALVEAVSIITAELAKEVVGVTKIRFSVLFGLKNLLL